MKLFCDSRNHCKKVLKDVRSIMLNQLAALLHLSLLDLVTSVEFATAFLTGGSLLYLLFLISLINNDF